MKHENITAERTSGSLHPVVRHPLVIPFDDGKYAVIPMGITADDFDCLQKTLVLWREKMVIPGEPVKESTVDGALASMKVITENFTPPGYTAVKDA